jgi:hypothetical protein
MRFRAVVCSDRGGMVSCPAMGISSEESGKHEWRDVLGYKMT